MNHPDTNCIELRRTISDSLLPTLPYKAVNYWLVKCHGYQQFGVKEKSFYVYMCKAQQRNDIVLSMRNEYAIEYILRVAKQIPGSIM